MKLLFYVDNFSRSGAAQERQLVQLCSALAERGHEVNVLADRGDEIPQVTLHRSLNTAVELCGRVLPDLCIDWRLAYPADIHYLGKSTYGAIIRSRLEASTGLTKLWKKFNYSAVEHRRITAKQYSLLANPAASLLAGSELIAAQAVEDGAERERIAVQHPAVNEKRFCPENLPDLGDDARRVWNAKDGDVFFLAIAEDVGDLDMGLLKSAFERTAKACKAKLVLAAPTPPDFAAEWLVHVPVGCDTLKLYAGADVMLQPTHFDAGSLFVAEAMACGLPVIAGKSSGANEIVRHEQSGFVLEIQTPLPWADAIGNLAKDADLRQRMGASAGETQAHSCYSMYVDWFESYITDVRKEKAIREDLVE